MKIEKEIIYNIVTSEGARLEVSEAELIELWKELGKMVISIKFQSSTAKSESSTVSARKDIWSQGEY